jgi:hypothetical protein
MDLTSFCATAGAASSAGAFGRRLTIIAAIRSNASAPPARASCSWLVRAICCAAARDSAARAPSSRRDALIEVDRVGEHEVGGFEMPVRIDVPAGPRIEALPLLEARNRGRSAIDLRRRRCCPPLAGERLTSPISVVARVIHAAGT